MQALKKTTHVEFEPFTWAIQQWYALEKQADLPQLTNFLSLTDPLQEYRMVGSVTHDPLSVQYGEVGAALEKLYGKPMAGRNLDELYNDWFRKKAYESYRFTIKERLPTYQQRSISVVIKKIGYHKLILPFGNETITDFITYIIPLDATIKEKKDWESLVNQTPWL